MRFRRRIAGYRSLPRLSLAACAAVPGSLYRRRRGYNLPENYPLLAVGVAAGAHGGGSSASAASVTASATGFGFEVEGNYRQGILHHSNGTPVPTAASGNVKTYGAMANAMFDIDIGVPWLYPYIGGGAGYQWTNLRNAASSRQPAFPLISVRDQTEGAFAWQAIGGLSFPMPNMPGLSLTSEYRFFGVPAARNSPAPSSSPALPAPVPSHQAAHQYNHSFLFGVRYAFNVAAPMPCTGRRRRRRHPRRRAPIWCSSIGTRRR